MLLLGNAETEVRAVGLGIDPAVYHQTRGGRTLALGELAENVYRAESRAACGEAHRRNHIGALPRLLEALDTEGLTGGVAADIRFALNQGGADNAEHLDRLVCQAVGELAACMKVGEVGS